MSNFLVQGGAPPDDSVTTVKVQDDAVNLAKMAGLARGTLIYGDASGDPAALAVGSADDVLTHDGTDIAWAAAGGKIVQIVNVQTGAVATGTTVMPLDDTIPQITEGDEYMTLAITPTNVSNKLVIDVVVQGASDADGTHSNHALFQDATAGALAAMPYNQRTGGFGIFPVNFKHYMTAGTVSETTFRVRAGQTDAGTFTFNGALEVRKNGGVNASSITITEISV